MNNTEPKSDAAARTTAVWLTLAAAIVAVVIRLIPFGMRPPNVAANGSLGIFGGSRTPWWCALPLMLLSLVVSDLLLWKMFGWEPFNPYVYSSFVLYMLIGRLMLRRSQSMTRIAAATLIGSSLFFLITNFGAWYANIGTSLQLFPPTPAGLLENYIFALPYFGFTVAGDLAFCAVLFGAEAWLLGYVTSTREAPLPEEVAS